MLVKSATCRNFINVSKGQIRINTSSVAEHLELNAHQNVNKHGFSPEAVAHFDIAVQTCDEAMLDASSLGLDI